MTSMTPRPMSTPNLAGILGKPKRPARALQSPEPEADPVPSEPLAPPPASLADRRQGAAQDDSGSSPVAMIDERVNQPGDEPATEETVTPARSYLRQMTVYLPRSLYERLQRQAARQGMSRTALMLTSVNATHERLSELMASQPAPRGALFEVPQARAPKAEPNMQTSIRVTDEQLSVLKALARQNGTTRSKVLATAIDAYLS